MFSYHRLQELYQLINLHNTISCGQLSKHLKVSERTIRSDILSINEVLSNYGAKVILKRNIGYQLEIKNTEKYEQFEQTLKHNHFTNDLDSSSDRIKFLLSKLLYLNDYVSLEDLANMVFISKNTMINYSKTIKTIIQNYDLEYISKTNEGIKIIGSEENKRKCLLENVLSFDFQNYIIGFTPEEYTLFEGIDIDYIKELVSSQLMIHKIKTNDFSLKNLMIHFALMVSRIQNNNSLKEIIPLIKEEDIEGCIQEINDCLSNYFKIEINEAEKNYIFQHFIANTNTDYISLKEKDIEEDVTNLLNSIYKNYNFDLRKDEILFHDLSLHFNSILKSKSYSLNKRNPLLNTIKNNFPLAFEITLTAIAEAFHSSKITLTEDEIGYVSLHIGAAIERCFSGVIQRKNVILVCGSGQATTRMLEARINVFFKDKIIITKKLSYHEFISTDKSAFKNVDFAISTIPINSNSIPTICVDFAINTKDIESISRFLTTISSDKVLKLNKFFDESIFIKANSFESKEELLKIMCDSLQTSKITNTEFFNSVMKREKIASTNMNDVFALPHPMELCANQTKVAVAILNKPLLWNDSQTVQIVLLLAIKQDEHINIEHLYDLFIQIVNNTKLQNEIIHSKNFNDFLKVLKNSI